MYEDPEDDIDVIEKAESNYSRRNMFSEANWSMAGDGGDVYK